MNLLKHQPNFFMKLMSLCLVVLLLLVYQSIAGARAEEVAANEAKIAEVEAYNRQVLIDNGQLDQITDLTYADGVYEGTGVGFGGDITVSVTVDNHVISSIEVLSHTAEDEAYYVQAEKILENMVAQNTNQVDVASGATFSSNGLIDAVGDALGKAVS